MRSCVWVLNQFSVPILHLVYRNTSIYCEIFQNRERNIDVCNHSNVIISWYHLMRTHYLFGFSWDRNTTYWNSSMNENLALVICSGKQGTKKCRRRWNVFYLNFLLLLWNALLQHVFIQINALCDIWNSCFLQTYNFLVDIERCIWLKLIYWRKKIIRPCLLRRIMAH